MVARVDVLDPTADPNVNLSAVVPSVAANECVLLRRHDSDSPNAGLLLCLMRLRTSRPGGTAVEAGRKRLRVFERAGGLADVQTDIVLSTVVAGHSPSIAALLASTSAAQLSTDGGSPVFSGGVSGDLPTGLTLGTVVSTDDVPHEITIGQANANEWFVWGGAIGQNFSGVARWQAIWVPP